MKKFKITVDDQVYEVLVEEVDSSGAGMAAPAQAAPQLVATPALPTGGSPVTAPLSSVVVEIHVSVGDTVTVGQTVATIEAMKMNTIVSASVAGRARESFRPYVRDPGQGLHNPRPARARLRH